MLTQVQVKLKILGDQIGALSHEGAGQEEVWFCGLTLGNVYCSKQSLLEVVITSILETNFIREMNDESEGGDDDDGDEEELAEGEELPPESDYSDEN